MSEFNDALEQKITDLVERYVGAGTDPNPDYVIKALDDHLRPFDESESPFVVVNVRQVEPSPPNIGAPYADKSWLVHIYYLSLAKVYSEGKAQRNRIVNKFVKAIEDNQLLDSFTYTGTDGAIDQVWTSQWETVTFDYSGEDGYYTFVSEMHLTVGTSTT